MDTVFNIALLVFPDVSKGVKIVEQTCSKQKHVYADLYMFAPVCIHPKCILYLTLYFSINNVAENFIDGKKQFPVIYDSCTETNLPFRHGPQTLQLCKPVVPSRFLQSVLRLRQCESRELIRNNKRTREHLTQPLLTLAFFFNLSFISYSLSSLSISLWT